MGDKLIEYANKENEEYMTIRLATRRGVRRTRVKKENVPKRYKKLKRKEETYARKIKVYDRLRNKVSTKTVVDKRKYIYNPEQRAYEKYAPDNRVQVKTTTGPRSVTHEQLKYLYKRRGGAYQRTKESERVVYDKPRYEPRRGRLQKSMQIAIKQRVIINGETHNLIGYSKVQRGDYSLDEMREQAKMHLKAAIIDHGGKYDLANVELSGQQDEEYVKWVYGNGNH